MHNILYICLAYLIGSIPFGLIINKLAGKGDIRKTGSGNIGATNVTRSAGKTAGIITLALDATKGIIAIIFITTISPTANNQLIMALAVAAVLGHMFPVALKFQGGKGVATGLAIFALLAWQITLIAIASWLIVFYAKKIVSLASITAMIVASTLALITNNQYVLAIEVIALLVIIKHHSNIKKLLKGEELAFK